MQNFDKKLLACAVLIGIGCAGRLDLTIIAALTMLVVYRPVDLTGAAKWTRDAIGTFFSTVLITWAITALIMAAFGVHAGDFLREVSRGGFKGLTTSAGATSMAATGLALVINIGVGYWWATSDRSSLAGFDRRRASIWIAALALVLLALKVWWPDKTVKGFVTATIIPHWITAAALVVAFIGVPREIKMKGLIRTFAGVWVFGHILYIAGGMYAAKLDEKGDKIANQSKSTFWHVAASFHSLFNAKGEKLAEDNNLAAQRIENLEKGQPDLLEVVSSNTTFWRATTLLVEAKDTTPTLVAAGNIFSHFADCNTKKITITQMAICDYGTSVTAAVGTRWIPRSSIAVRDPFTGVKYVMLFDAASPRRMVMADAATLKSMKKVKAGLETPVPQASPKPVEVARITSVVLPAATPLPQPKEEQVITLTGQWQKTSIYIGTNDLVQWESLSGSFPSDDVLRKMEFRLGSIGNTAGPGINGDSRHGYIGLSSVRTNLDLPIEVRTLGERATVKLTVLRGCYHPKA